MKGGKRSRRRRNTAAVLFFLVGVFLEGAGEMRSWWRRGLILNPSPGWPVAGILTGWP